VWRQEKKGMLAAMEWMTNPDNWLALVTLTVLEIVLGIDNIIFISILVGKLPKERRSSARTLGLALAMITRILLLLSLAWLTRLTAPLFTLFEHGVSGRDLILLGGGLFLLAKATHEIHARVEGGEEAPAGGRAASYGSVIVQILLLDVVFSLDSVITAVGMANEVMVMIVAIIIAVGVMMIAAGPISRFIEQHPTVKMLALAFLLLIGMTLIADGLGQHIPKDYIYFAIGFSIFVEFLNWRARRRTAPPLPVEEIARQAPL
jgi:predicted tellurium resistance membrane protein TerC